MGEGAHRPGGCLRGGRFCLGGGGLCVSVCVRVSGIPVCVPGIVSMQSKVDYRSGAGHRLHWNFEFFSRGRGFSPPSPASLCKLGQESLSNLETWQHISAQRTTRSPLVTSLAIMVPFVYPKQQKGHFFD